MAVWNGPAVLQNLLACAKAGGASSNKKAYSELSDREAQQSTTHKTMNTTGFVRMFLTLNLYKKATFRRTQPFTHTLTRATPHLTRFSCSLQALLSVVLVVVSLE